MGAARAEEWKKVWTRNTQITPTQRLKIKCSENILNAMPFRDLSISACAIAGILIEGPQNAVSIPLSVMNCLWKSGWQSVDAQKRLICLLAQPGDVPAAVVPPIPLAIRLPPEHHYLRQQVFSCLRSVFAMRRNQRCCQ